MESLLVAQTLLQRHALLRSAAIPFTWSKHDTLYLYTISNSRKLEHAYFTLSFKNKEHATAQTRHIS